MPLWGPVRNLLLSFDQSATSKPITDFTYHKDITIACDDRGSMIQARDAGLCTSLSESLALGLVRAVQPGLVVGLIAAIVGGHIH